ncbi:MAG TPA: DoxX family membrane protein [Chloroflexota bacterium]|nr:DoxX family membrane protein [Chloroflexota bacterium]
MLQPAYQAIIIGECRSQSRFVVLRQRRERIDVVRKRGIAEGFLAGFGLTCVRVILGYFWLSRVLANPPPTFGCPGGGFCLMIDQAVRSPYIQAIGGVLESVVQPNPAIFAWLVAFAQVAIGLILVLGILTRLGGLLGLILSLAFLVATAGIPGDFVWYYASMALLSTVFFAIGGANQLSVDQVVGWRTWWGEAF